jgi:EAL domain-containing protein (putative c-di-GMP-specific phosphodiesterase class I)/CheY-like chemotaxis protein
MKNLNVLVLHDHPFSRMVIVTALRTMVDCRIYEASANDQAIALLKACGGVDIAICNLNMEGQDGLTFLREASELSLIHSVITDGASDSTECQPSAASIECLDLEYLGRLERPLHAARLASQVARFQRGSRHSLPPDPHEIASLEEVVYGMQHGEFKPYYQPIVDINGKTLLAAEVLARWHHRSRGLLLPGAFLPTIVANGLIPELFQIIFEQGLSLLRDFCQQGRPTTLAFNLHPSQLASPQLTHFVSGLLAQHQVPATAIVFEITEDAMISTPAIILDNLVTLRDMGCGLSMDDFGAGHSSLDRLCSLPVTQLKLDATFARRLRTQARAALIIRGIVQLSDALQLPLVIEGVESLEQQTQLRELGCTIAQGYLYARPMPTDHFLGFCRTHEGYTPPCPAQAEDYSA